MALFLHSSGGIPVQGNAPGPNDVVLPSTGPGELPASEWEGLGPLAGCLLKGTNLKAPFDPMGLRFLPVVDLYGNAWILNCDGASAVTSSQGVLQTDVYLNTVDGQQKFQQCDERNMAAQGWQGWKRLVDQGGGNDLRFAGDGAFVYDDRANDRAPSEGGGRSGSLPWLHPSTGLRINSDTVALADNPVVTASALDPTNPYVYNVPIQLPVDPNDQASFGGWVLCRVNRFTRIATIVSLWQAGWASAKKKFDQQFSLDALLVAVGKTILGIIEIIVGVLVTIGTLGGGAPAGVALVATGISTIIEAWYDFAQKIGAHAQAVNNTLAAGGAIDSSLVGLLKQMRKQSSSSGPSGQIVTFVNKHPVLSILLAVGGVVVIVKLVGG